MTVKYNTITTYICTYWKLSAQWAWLSS